MRGASIEEKVRLIIDRQEIVECLLRYTRGLDRLDLGLYRSAFHDDGLDCRGGEPRTPEEFLRDWLPRQPARDVTQHHLTNFTIDLDGDVAHVESYHTVAVKLTESDEMDLHGGRYIDRVERRAGRWAIAVRVVIPQWHARVPVATGSVVLARSDWAERSVADPSYERPLLPR